MKWGEILFRDCHFNYAGVSSQPYGLIMSYVGSGIDSFDSGGKFELKSTAVPRSHETLLYGKDYSASPLTFEVEIVNIDEAIPLKQMTEIKNWLFGQDGWRTLTLLDERQNYCLKCILEPIEDIADGLGYRGVRCNIHNISPFWYGEEKEIIIDSSGISTDEFTITTTDTYENETVTKYSALDIYIPEEDIVGLEIFPVLEMTITQTTLEEEEDATVAISNTKATSINDVKQYNSSSGFSFPDITYTAFFFTNTNLSDLVTIDTKYAIMSAQSHPSIGWHFPNAYSPLPIFRLHSGHNYIRVCTGCGYLTQIKIRYTPVYRLGAF